MTFRPEDDTKGENTLSTFDRRLERFCQWKDGSTSWTKLSDLKELHPIETSEYTIAQGIDGYPTINWWATHVIKKRAHIISLEKKRSARYLKKNHKFGVELPKSAQHAFVFDKKMVTYISHIPLERR